MRIRVLELVNNFYKDEDTEGCAETTGDDSRQELGEYCCLGYFDALNVRSLDCGSRQEMNIRREAECIAVRNLEGKDNRKNIICVTNDEKRDEDFWKLAERMPFLFVSLIRIKFPGQHTPSDIVKTVNAKSEETMAYYTYGHSDIVVFRTGNEYLKNMTSVLSMYEEVNIYKMYSVFAVKECVLENCEGIPDEMVTCRLNGAVQNMEHVKVYIDKLKEALKSGNNAGDLEINCFYTLGNSDFLMEIPKVSLINLLKCYKMGEVLTHTDEDYKKAFFNISSSILNKKEWEKEESGNGKEAKSGAENGELD